MRKVSITQAIDRDGRHIVIVPLAGGGGVATVYVEDFDALLRRGYSTHWTLNPAGVAGYAYVRVASTKVAGCLESVARLIMRPGRGAVVRYRDGDRTNLRRSNLWIARGHAPGQSPARRGTASELLEHAHQPHREAA